MDRRPILGPVLIGAAAVVGLALGLHDAPRRTGAASVVRPEIARTGARVVDALPPRGVALRPPGTDQVIASRLPTAVRLEEHAVEDLVAQALGAAGAVERAAALDALAYAAAGTPGTDTYVDTVLLQSLADTDEQVRRQALETIKDAAREFPAEAVARVARDDPSAAVRVQALELLLERCGDRARHTLQVALADPEPVVRARAQELLDEAY